MAAPRSSNATEMKNAQQLRAEEEARVEIARARAMIDARRDSKAKAEDEIWGEMALEKARAKALAAENAIKEEEARIDATGKDAWFYIQNEVQSGPVTLVRLRELIADLSVDPPVKLVWAAGMDRWKPVYEVRRVCESVESQSVAGGQSLDCPGESELVRRISDKLAGEKPIRSVGEVSSAARDRGTAAAKARPVDSESERIRAENEAIRKVAERAGIVAEEKARRENEESARTRAETEAKLRAAEEARASAEAKAAAESALRVTAEAKATAEARNAAEVRARAQAAEELRAGMERAAQMKALEETRLRNVAEESALKERKLREVAEQQAFDESRRREAAEAKAAETARSAAETHAKVEREARAKAELEAKEAEQTRIRAAAEIKAAEMARLTAETHAKAEREARAKAEIQAKAAEDARIKAAAAAKAAELARVAAETQAKAEREARAKAEAEAKAAEDGRLRILAEAKAAEDARIKAAAEAKAAELARVAAETQAKAEQEARAKAEAEAKAAEDGRLRILAEAKAAEDTRIKAAAAAKAAELARVAAETQAKAEQEARAKAEAEAKAAEDGRLRILAEAKAAEDARIEAAAAAKAAELARVAAETQAKAEQDARIKAAAEAKAAEDGRLRILAEAKAAEDARIEAAAAAKAAELARVAAETQAKAEQEARAKAEAEAKEKAKIKTRTAKRRQVKWKKLLRALAHAKLRVQARIKGTGLTHAAAVSKDTGKPAPNAAESCATRDLSTSRSVELSDSNDELPVKAFFGKKIWFYTCEGERLGPVSFDELKSLAIDSALDPRLDMVWKKDMAEWKPAGRIDGLFERCDAPIADAETPAAEVKSSYPAGKDVISKKPHDAPWPGALRSSLLFAAVVFPFVWYFALGAANPFMTKQLGSAMMARILPVTTLVPLVVFVFFSLRRLVNLGMSRWWYLAMFAPVLNLWLGYRCFACPPGYAHSRKMDAPGVFLAILYWFAVLASLYILALAVAPMLGGFDTAEWSNKIRTAIRTVTAAVGPH